MSNDNNRPRIAIVHEWLTYKGGGEALVGELIELWPEAPLFTIISDASGQCQSLLEGRQVQNSFISKFPFAKRWYRSYLLFMPLAVEQFDLSNFDIIISSSHAVAKGVITGPDQLHISYVHSPIRYAWDLQHQYLNQSGYDKGIKGALARLILHYIRSWDYRTANGVDHFISNSNFIARRIWKIYRRRATIINPPVDVNKFTFEENKENYYITASRVVPYKRIELIVDAFSTMPEKKLIVIGDGPDLKKIQKRVGHNITLMGYQPFDVLNSKLGKAKGFIFAAEEDFGIAPVEAQACGTPVIAYGKGGALETVVEGKTGMFFHEQNVRSVIESVNRFESGKYRFSPRVIRDHAMGFSTERFKREMQGFVNTKWSEFLNNNSLKGSTIEETF